jgi:hypothetical protein
MTAYELRTREGLDDSEPSLPYMYQARAGASLADVLKLASMPGTDWLDVHADGEYLVTSGWYWWLPGEHGGGMHQIGSHGWCHDCHREGLGYVHHLAYETELAVLAHEARTDSVLHDQCEADGLTPEQYAREMAGRAVPLDGDMSFVIDVHELGVNAAGLAEFAVDMWDMTTWKVAVKVAPGAPGAAEKLAEKLAYAATPKRCWNCKGRRGHSKRCPETRWTVLMLDSSQARA